MPYPAFRKLGLWPILLLVTGCVSIAPRYSFSPIPTAHQLVKFADGIPFVFSRQTHLVSISLPEDDGTLESEFSLIAVSIVNCGSQSFVIDARNLQISSDNPKLRIVPETEIQDRINSRAMWARIATAFASAANVAAASMPTTTTYSGGVYGGGQYVGYSGVASTYDPARAALASSAINQQQARTDREIEEARRAQVDALASGFKRHTLGPNNVYIGGVYVENKQLRRASSVQLSVNIGPESHRFEVLVDGPGSTAAPIDYAEVLPPPERRDVAVPTAASIPPSAATTESLNQPAAVTASKEPDAPVTSIFKNQRLTFETKDGRKLVHARVLDFTADYVIVSTLDGVFTLRKTELPDGIAQLLPEPPPAASPQPPPVTKIEEPAGAQAETPTDEKKTGESAETKSWWERLFD
jgi:hypothetical protein